MSRPRRFLAPRVISPAESAAFLAQLEQRLDDAEAAEREWASAPRITDGTHLVRIPALCPHPDSQIDHRAVVPALPAHP